MPHYNRPGGVESATPTAWVPQSKPFWLMEIGCPAVDKGANQPNVFVDPKSSESALPYFSRGTRDDLIQRRYLRALIEAFDPDERGLSWRRQSALGVYGARMVDLDRIHVYCWDARPYPPFPTTRDVWGDGDNWRLGHWLNGRFASGAAGRNGGAHAGRLRISITSTGSAEWHRAGLCHRPRDVAARCAAAAGARLLLRLPGKRREHHVSPRGNERAGVLAATISSKPRPGERS